MKAAMVMGTSTAKGGFRIDCEDHSWNQKTIFPYSLYLPMFQVTVKPRQRLIVCDSSTDGAKGSGTTARGRRLVKIREDKRKRDYDRLHNYPAWAK